MDSDYVNKLLMLNFWRVVKARYKLCTEVILFYILHKQQQKMHIYNLSKVHSLILLNCANVESIPEVRTSHATVQRFCSHFRVLPYSALISLPPQYFAQQP